MVEFQFWSNKLLTTTLTKAMGALKFNKKLESEVS